MTGLPVSDCMIFAVSTNSVARPEAVGSLATMLGVAGDSLGHTATRASEARRPQGSLAGLT